MSSVKRKRILVVEFDVTDLDDRQMGELEIAAVVQGERKKVSFPDEVGYPDVPVRSWIEERTEVAVRNAADVFKPLDNE